MLKRCLTSLVVAGCLALSLLPVSPVFAGRKRAIDGHGADEVRVRLSGDDRHARVRLG